MKVVPGRRYTRAELQEAISQSDADELKLKGYVLQYDALSSTYSVIPWTEAASGEKFGTFRPDDRGGTGVFDPLPPIVKRTPMERVDALMLRLVEDCKRAGTVPGLEDERIKLITGEAWKSGRSEVTGEVVRTVAADLLRKAEKEAQLAK